MGCSPIKAVRELGSERRETVRSLSGVGVGYLRGLPLVREDRGGLAVVYLLFYQEHGRVAKPGRDKR